MVGLGVTGDAFTIKVDWKSPSAEVRKFIEEQNETKHDALELQLEYKDPEKTGRFSSGDLYLVLKDLYLDEKEIVIMLGSNDNSLFTEDQSYMGLMTKLNWLYFHVLHLNKNLYKRAKNVCISKDIFFDIIYALVCCGVLRILKPKAKQQRGGVDDSHDQQDSAVLGTSESSLGGAFANAIGGKVRANKNKQSESSEQTPSSSKKRSQEQSSKDENHQSMRSKDPSLLAEKKPHELSPQGSRNQVPNSHPTSKKQPEPSQQERESSQHNRINRKNEARSHSKSSTYLDPRAVPEHNSKQFLEQLAEPEVYKRPDLKSAQKLLKPRQTNQTTFIDIDVHAPLFLKKHEPIWKKSLSEVFHFYSRLQKQTKPLERSFENSKEKWNNMCCGEWLKFCLDFELRVAAKKDGKPSATNVPVNQLAGMDSNRMLLASLFNKEAKGSLGINYSGFEVNSAHHRKYSSNSVFS